jgi:hypothetical protein
MAKATTFPSRESVRGGIAPLAEQRPSFAGQEAQFIKAVKPAFFKKKGKAEKGGVVGTTAAGKRKKKGKKGKAGAMAGMLLKRFQPA